jgi:hypothetical protein
MNRSPHLQHYFAAAEAGGASPRWSGARVHSLCLCHDDRDPSFDACDGAKGVVGLCRVCGATLEDQVARLPGISMSDLFFEGRASAPASSNTRPRIGPPRPQPAKPPKDAPPPTWTDDPPMPLTERPSGFSESDVDRDGVRRYFGGAWPYEVDEGQPAHIAGRSDALKVRWNRPAPLRKLFHPHLKQGDGWRRKPGLDGAKLRPYRADELRAYAGKAIPFITEGEKCADPLRAAGYIATTNDAGAGKWEDRHADYLRDLGFIVCVVWPDPDAPGLYHAATILRTLLARGITVRVIRPAADAYDYRARFSDDEAFAVDVNAMVQAAPDATMETAAALDAEADAMKGKEPPPPPVTFLVAKPAPDWVDGARNRPVPAQLCDTLWFEGEVCILYASTNVGKSILAVQIADSIARGVPVRPFRMEGGARTVLYLDFELSDRQFALRYTDDHRRAHGFDRRLIRVEINPDAILEGEWEATVQAEIERLVEETGARVVIVDNLTFLKRNTQDAKDALPFMQALVGLKRRLGLSILVLAHTPKRDESRPLTENDLAGSRHLLNFADSAFAMGRSAREDGLRYLKQIKVRNAELSYGAENVALFRLEKQGAFLGLTFKDYAEERDHLREMTREERSDVEAKVLERHEQGQSNRTIAAELGTSHTRVGRILAKLKPSTQDGGTGGTGVTGGTPLSTRSTGDGSATAHPHLSLDGHADEALV